MEAETLEDRLLEDETLEDRLLEDETLVDRLLKVSYSLEEIFKQATVNEPVSRGGRDTRGQNPGGVPFS
jgi:hypothetical protein